MRGAPEVEMTVMLLLLHFIFPKAQPNSPKRHFSVVASTIPLATAAENMALSSLRALLWQPAPPFQKARKAQHLQNLLTAGALGPLSPP